MEVPNRPDLHVASRKSRLSWLIMLILQVLGCPGHIVSSSVELWNKSVVVVKESTNRRKVLANCCPGYARRTVKMKSMSLGGGSFRS